MGDVVQFATKFASGRPPLFPDAIAPEHIHFASKCMEYFYDKLGYDVMHSGEPVIRPRQGLVSHNDNYIMCSADKALHDDICDTIHAYVLEERMQTPVQHRLIQRRHINDLTGLTNQLIAKKTPEHAQLTTKSIQSLLRTSVMDASIYYYGTNLFPETHTAR